MSDLLAPAPPHHRRRRRGGLQALLALVALGVLIVALVVGGRALLASFAGPAVADYAGAGSGAVTVVVGTGQTAGQVAATLLRADVVKSEAAFTAAARADPKSRRLQPGTYALHQHMSGAAALAALLDPANRLLARVVLPEGVPLAQALTAMSTVTRIPLAQFRAAVSQPDALGLPSYAHGQVEGFLFPATYDVQPGTTAVQLLATMVGRFKQAAAAVDLERRSAALGLTPYQVVTTASLIEKETAYPADRPKVARVVYNRLARNMMLQFDSTVNYLRTQKKANLTLGDLKVPSAYNTYLHTGLPPTPIDSPGQAALDAALSPAAGDYVYFVTVSKTGQALFTNDYNAFLRAKAKAQSDGVY